jgi:hypothetical protein
MPRPTEKERPTMDPNATVTEILDLRQELRTARDSGYSDKDIQRVLDDIKERKAALREWKARGGFAPHVGWTFALSL